MKTSYKIITAFIIIIFTAQFITSISLKAKYKKGDFNIPDTSSMNIFEMGSHNKIELSDFKNIVINSAIITKNGREVRFNSNFSISSSNKKNILGIPKKLASLLRTHISNDTLYVSFQKNTINQDNLERTYFPEIVIEAKDLHSLNVKNSNYRVNTIQTSKPFALVTESSNVNLGYIKTNLVTLNVGTRSTINFEGYDVNKKNTVPAKIDSLNYTLSPGSSIKIGYKELIGKIRCLNPSQKIHVGYSKSLIINHYNDLAIY